MQIELRVRVDTLIRQRVTGGIARMGRRCNSKANRV